MVREAEFIEAAKQGDAAKVGSFLKADPGLVRAVGDHLKTALHWAAEADQVEVAAALVEAGADIEARTSWGASPLDWAATMGSSRVADLLLARGATGLTLITAASLGKLFEVRRIVESSEDLSAHRRRGAPAEPNEYWPADSAHIREDTMSDALYAAARNGHLDVVDYLLDQGADIDAKGVFGATGLPLGGDERPPGNRRIPCEAGRESHDQRFQIRCDAGRVGPGRWPRCDRSDAAAGEVNRLALKHVPAP